MGRIELYKDKSDCCGCEACVNICKRNAIKMQEDEYGFLYPQIDSSLCVECGQCKKVCSYQNENTEFNEPLLAEAATVTDREICLKSASGGIFAALAKKILQEGEESTAVHLLIRMEFCILNTYVFNRKMI